MCVFSVYVLPPFLVATLPTRWAPCSQPLFGLGYLKAIGHSEWIIPLLILASHGCDKSTNKADRGMCCEFRVKLSISFNSFTIISQFT